ncbi:AAA family ATPase [Pseudomonas sp. PSE14]|uniref:AAA family ATPase n=1 Tax=Pseudomonas sp. PSE14 TaxID=3016341 RepID=UPI0023D853A2|nr:AAA family ATPase [Pseudomonas sp. PSE14]WEJ74574.1 AAA family ATPase [Pseudomonas sp. PSE14]
MASIKKIGVRGLRSFGYDSQLIPFSKLNIYVGKNSCGKSSFLRTFPLLRQSVESDTRFPILWYAGHGGYVDFGDFETTLHDGGESIHFDFELSTPPNPAINIPTYNPWDESDRHTIKSPTGRDLNILATISLHKKDGVLITTIDFSTENTKTTLKYSGEEVINLTYENTKFNVLEKFSNPLHIIKGSLIPKSAVRRRELNLKSLKSQRIVFSDTLENESLNALSKYLSTFHHRSKQLKNIRQALEYIPLSQGNELYILLRAIFSSDKHFLKKLDENRKEIVDVTFTYLFAKNIGSFWSSADDLFKKFYRGVRYLGPIRASAERFYRFQDLQIGEIDHTGANLPMVINSLREEQRINLGSWIRDNFGFELHLETTGLHYALLIRENGDSKFHNVSDMGFGYSQILPVIVSIWMELTGESVDLPRAPSWLRERASRSIVIEQPELHLHPALQYSFGLAIAKVIKLSNHRDYNFIIETHSKHLIDAIGQSIAEDTIKNSDVNISLFEKDPSGSTKVSLSGYDNDGYLINWPAGFLSA